MDKIDLHIAIARANVERRERELKAIHQAKLKKDIEPRLENLINCCAEGAIDNLKIILTENEKKLVAEPNKILNAYLNYSATGHDKVLLALNDFVSKNKLNIKDNEFECVYYLVKKDKTENFLKLFDANLWHTDRLFNYLRDPNTFFFRNHSNKNLGLELSVELEKRLLANTISETTMVNPDKIENKKSFKI